MMNTPTAEAVETSTVNLEDLSIEELEARVNESFSETSEPIGEPEPSEPVGSTETEDGETADTAVSTDEELAEDESTEPENEPVGTPRVKWEDEFKKLQASHSRSDWELGELRKMRTQFNEFGTLIKNPAVARAILNAQSGGDYDAPTDQPEDFDPMDPNSIKKHVQSLVQKGIYDYTAKQTQQQKAAAMRNFHLDVETKSRATTEKLVSAGTSQEVIESNMLALTNAIRSGLGPEIAQLWANKDAVVASKVKEAKDKTVRDLQKKQNAPKRASNMASGKSVKGVTGVPNVEDMNVTQALAYIQTLSPGHPDYQKIEARIKAGTL